MRTIDPSIHEDPEIARQWSEDRDEVSFLDLLIVLSKSKKLIFWTTTLVAVLTVIISLIIPATYTATEVILPPQNASVGSALLSQLSSMGPLAALAGGGLGLKSSNDLYISMFQSRTVQEAMVKRFNLRGKYKRLSDARNAFAGKCEIKAGPKDGLLSISITDSDPNRAAELTTAYVEEFKKLTGTIAISEASQRRLFFEQQLMQAKDNLANAEEALKKTEQATGMFVMDSQARSLIEAAASLRGQIASKEVEIHAMRSYASDGNPDLRMAEQQLAAWRAQLTRLTGDKNGNEDDLLLSKGQVPTAGLEYVRKVRDVKYYETIFELLARQFEMAKLDEAKQGAIIQVIDPAVPPDRRTSPKRAVMVIVATFCAFFLSIFFVLIRAFIVNVQKDPQNKSKVEELRAMLLPRKRELSP
jgi:tyrosine-protein kinase Etk/Wzc